MMKSQFMEKVLSPEQQKKIYGGLGGCSIRLCCTTPNGNECWNRSTINGSADSACQGIYPAYGGAVSGGWELNCGVIQVVEIEA